MNSGHRCLRVLGEKPLKMKLQEFDTEVKFLKNDPMLSMQNALQSFSDITTMASALPSLNLYSKQEHRKQQTLLRNKAPTRLRRQFSVMVRPS